MFRPTVYTWTPKVCKIMVLMAIILGVGLLFYILLGFRYMQILSSCNLCIVPYINLKSVRRMPRLVEKIVFMPD